MKRYLMKSYLLAIPALMLAVFYGCDGDDDNEQLNPTVTISGLADSVKVEDSIRFSYSVDKGLDGEQLDRVEVGYRTGASFVTIDSLTATGLNESTISRTVALMPEDLSLNIADSEVQFRVIASDKDDNEGGDTASTYIFEEDTSSPDPTAPKSRMSFTLSNTASFICTSCQPISSNNQNEADGDPGVIDFRYFYSSSGSNPTMHNLISADVLATSAYDNTNAEWDNGTNTTDFYTTNVTPSEFMNLDDQSKLESMATSGQLTEHPGNPNGARVGDQSTVGSLDVDDVIGFQTMVGSGNSKYGLIHIASKDGQNEQITVNIKVQKQ